MWWSLIEFKGTVGPGQRYVILVLNKHRVLYLAVPWSHYHTLSLDGIHALLFKIVLPLQYMKRVE